MNATDDGQSLLRSAGQAKTREPYAHCCMDQVGSWKHHLLPIPIPEHGNAPKCREPAVSIGFNLAGRIIGQCTGTLPWAFSCIIFSPHAQLRVCWCFLPSTFRRDLSRRWRWEDLCTRLNWARRKRKRGRTKDREESRGSWHHRRRHRLPTIKTKNRLSRPQLSVNQRRSLVYRRTIGMSSSSTTRERRSSCISW